MMKSSHKPHKSTKDPSMKKSHLSKKSLHSRSPMRLSGGARPTIKHVSPGMKRGHLLIRKASHSPRLRSIASSPRRSLSHRSKPESPVSIERVHTMKGIKYEKRRQVSNSPDRHSTPHRCVEHFDSHDMPSYTGERYTGSSSAHSPYASPTRKKSRRNNERYFSQSMSASPPRRHHSATLHSESHMSHRTENLSTVLHHRHPRDVPSVHTIREKHSYDGRNKHHTSPPMLPSNHSKETSNKAHYSNASSSSQYHSSSPTGRYLLSGTKIYGPTLHERFSTVVESNRSEPRVQYSREDLEKITIDIRRPLRETSPTLRQIVNPSDVKLVRRANEGHRPIFDREEIKQAPRDMREDAYYERKKTNASYSSMHGIDLREVENYQITRHRFDSHHNLFTSGSGKTLNDRWQNPEGRKEAINLVRDEREKEYQQIPISKTYISPNNRLKSGDRDFRSERYLDPKPSVIRSEYSGRPPTLEPRNSVSYTHRKSTMAIDARHKLNVRKSDREGHSSSVHPESKSHFHSHSDRHYTDVIHPPRVDRRDHHPPNQESQKWNYRNRSLSKEKLDYPRRSEKLSYKSWNDKPNVPPRGSNYFEYDNREGSSSFHTRGSNNRPFFRNTRGGLRNRGISRGLHRGNSYIRGSFRGSYHTSNSLRSRGPFRR